MQVVYDLMLLNILWIVCSLPLITAGTSACAAFSVLLKLARKEPVHTAKDFFKAFKVNFKQGLVLGLIALGAAAILYVDFSFAMLQDGKMKIVFLIIYGFVMAVYLIFLTYVFPLQARYENTVKAQIKNSFLLTFCAPGKTLKIWIIYAIPVALIVFLPLEILLYIAIFYFLFGLTLPAYFSSKTFRQVFDIFVKDNTNNDKRRSEEAC